MRIVGETDRPIKFLTAPLPMERTVGLGLSLLFSFACNVWLNSMVIPLILHATYCTLYILASNYKYFVYASITMSAQKSKATDAITSYVERVHQARRLSALTAPSTAIFRLYTECHGKTWILEMQYSRYSNEKTLPTKTYRFEKNSV